MARSTGQTAIGRLLVGLLVATVTVGCRRPTSTPPAASDASTQAVPASRYPGWLRSAQQQNRAAVALTSRSAAAAGGFEQNVGQFEGDARFIARTTTGVVLLRPNAMTTVVAARESSDAPTVLNPLTGGQAPASPAIRAVDLRLVATRGQTNLRPVGLLPRTVSYFYERDPKGWQRDVSSYERIIYEQLYPGIDLAVYQAGDDVKYDFVVAPGASTASIQLKVEGADGVAIDSAGDLVLRIGDSELRHKKPVIYQEAQGNRRIIEGGFVERAGAIGFRTGDYDPRLPLVIDPTIVQRYSTVLTGGIGHAQSLAVAVAPDGEVFVTGWANVFTSATAFTKDAFVAWYDGANGGQKHASFFGGKKNCTPNVCNADDIGAGIFVDGNEAKLADLKVGDNRLVSQRHRMRSTAIAATTSSVAAVPPS